MKILNITIPLMAALLMGCAEPKSLTVETPQEAIAALKAGNNRFVEGKTTHPNQALEYVESLEDGQAPYAVVVACSDSRVPVELLFDQGFGDLFVVRTAGNSVIDTISQGSVDYAINHLGVKLVLILGHSSCGAITGVVYSGDGHGHGDDHDDGEVTAMLTMIGDKIPEYVGKGCCLDEAIQTNVDVQVASLIDQAHIANKINAGELIVTSAIYDLSSGEVIFAE